MDNRSLTTPDKINEFWKRRGFVANARYADRSFTIQAGVPGVTYEKILRVVVSDLANGLPKRRLEAKHG